MAFKKLVTALAAGALLLTGCTGGNVADTKAQEPVDTSKVSGEITFQTWALKGDRFSPYFEKVIAEFQAKHPGTKINWIDQPADGYEDKVLQQANAGGVPDVINVPDGMAVQLAKAGKLTELKAAAPGSLDAYVPGAVEAYSRGEGIEGTFAYPWYLGTDVSWWRTDKLKQAGIETLPTTFDEFLSAAKTAAERTKGEVKLIDAPPRTDQFGGTAMFDGKKFVFNTAENAAMVDRYAELYRAGAIPPEVLAGTTTDNGKFFAQGKLGFVTGTGSFVSQLQKDAPTILPQVDASPRVVPPPLFVQGLGVSRESKNPALALAFAQYVTNDANQLEFVKIARGFLPGTKAGNADSAKLTDGVTDPLMKKAMTIAGEQMSRAKVNKVVEYTDDMQKYTDQQVALAISGKISSKEALDKAVQYCNEKLGS